MITYILERDPYDSETVFTGKLRRSFEPGLTILVGCNGYGKSTVIDAVKRQYSKEEGYKVFSWNGLTDKSYARQSALDSQRYDVLASLSLSSEGEEINTNIGLLAGQIGSFVKRNGDRDIIVLLDGLDSGLSVDNIVEVKEFFKEMLIPDIEDAGHKCYVIIPANEYELACGERCIDARTGRAVKFADYDAYRDYILETRLTKDNR